MEMPTRTEFIERAEGAGVPNHTAYALAAWVWNAEPGGGFLSALLSNDLDLTVSRADGLNRAALVDIVKFLWWNVPADCHSLGSEPKEPWKGLRAG